MAVAFKMSSSQVLAAVALPVSTRPIHIESSAFLGHAGENGTIDGQGSVWWDMWKKRTLPFTRPHLLELMYSTDVVVSNLVFQDSPFWNVHPVYCSNVVIANVTVLAPHDSPNTDGIDIDSSNNVCVEDCYISVGDDLISIKSGWDEYGIAFSRPSSGITIRRISGSGPFAGFAVGSETSGGVENVFVEHMDFFSMGVGIHIKTNLGRGGFIRNITVSEVTLNGARFGLRIAGDVGGHPDTSYNPNMLPAVDSVTIKNVWGQNIKQAGLVRGIRNSVFSRICLSNVKLYGSAAIGPWKCRDVSGGALDVQPSPCTELASTSEKGSCTVSSAVKVILSGFNPELHMSWNSAIASRPFPWTASPVSIALASPAQARSTTDMVTELGWTSSFCISLKK
ncbi:hypothetical protein U9M48_045021 [Paspalum notatum var. saurae]|uniref:Polygalacturonase n=1 Tax=Paspalum notatum var. saurae TaxID=547442 RepID=A0AAQ3UY39_PASNO